MDKKKLQERLMAGFLAELQEHVEALNRDLLALEKEADEKVRAQHVHSLFRTAHTLKSASRAVGLQGLEHLSHRVENFISRIRAGELALDESACQVLFDGADLLREAGVRLARGETLERSFFQSLLARISEERVSPPARAEGRGKSRSRPTGKDSVPSPPQVAAKRTPAAEPELPQPATSVGEPTPSVGASSVRVAAHKLDSLLTHSAEMRVTLQRLRTSEEGLAEIRLELERLHRDWELCAPAMQVVREVLPGGPSRLLQGIAERLRRLDGEVRRTRTAMLSSLSELGQSSRILERDVQAVRMLPFREACQGLERVVRDLARTEQKEVALIVEGGAVELDRSVLEELRDPLLHLVRNAVAHGAERPVERKAAGKPREATVRVAAVLRRGQVEVRVEDDGRGVDLQGLRNRALARGVAEEELPRDLCSLLFLPGFSTVDAPTELSGRGVGLDVVKTQVERVRGAIEFSSEQHHGTSCKLTLPLTLTTVSSLLVTHQGAIYAIPSGYIQSLRRLQPDELQSSNGRDVLMLEDEPIPVAPLSAALNGAPGTSVAPERRLLLVVLAAGAGRVALVVDELLDIEEVLVRPLSPRLGRIRGISGGAVLHTGRTALVLYPPAVVERVLGQPGLSGPLRGGPRKERALVHRLLLVDDSLTTRSLERMILESAGYSVLVAAHGAEAWELLQQREVELVVADVEMPHMDGIELTRTIRASERLAELPVILVTGLESEADRARGLEAGANAYLVKSSFDQRVLLETIAQLL